MNKKSIKNEIKTKKTRIIFSIVILLLMFAIIYVIQRGNYLEIKEIGENYLGIYNRNYLFTSITFAVNFILLFSTFYITNKKIKKALEIFFKDENKEMPSYPNKSVCLVLALIGSAATSKILINKLLLAISNSKFGLSDPVFKLDLGFFVFYKPFIKLLIIYLLAIVIGTILYALFYAIIVLNNTFDGVSKESLDKVNLKKIFKGKIIIIAILACLLFFISMVTNIGNENFMSIELSDGNSYNLFGAGKADVTLKLWGYVFLSILVLYSILKAYKAITENRMKGTIGNILIVPVYFILLAIVLALYQGIFIGNNTIEKELPYIKDNIEFTKSSYGIDVSTDSVKYSGTITEKELNENSNLLDNTPIVSSQNVLQDLESFQTEKGYYTFRNTQVELYNMNNEPTMLYVTPREMSNENATYSNKTYQYTHGYGSVITKAGKTDESGYLENTGTDLGDLSKQEVPITQPRIYYGLQTNDPVIINSTKDEFDYIDSTTNEDNFYKYDGDSGITLNFFDRLILGMKEGNLKLATSASIKRESKILTNRNIIQRAKTIMPYLIYDNNPYLVIDDKGNQFWVIDAYTTSNEVPFSQKTEINGINSINYIKNSCKVIINAYDGTTKFYIVDRTDPIIMAYNTIYPEIFSNEKISDDISKHFVYPKYLYEIQMKLIEKYHNIEPEILYRGNDIWQVADITGEDEKVKTAAPYYTVIKDNNNYELGLIIPYSIYKKQNFVSYLIGTYENGEAKLKIKEFSKDDNVLGFVQLESQINQDETIAQEIASLNTSGTKNTKNIFAIPVNNTLLYVETIYQQLINETNQKPTLKRVIVASGNKVAIGNTIDEALKSLVSQYATNINFVNTDDTESILNEIIKTNDNVRNSSKTNDWKLLGEDLEKLTGLIDNLKTTREEQNKVNEENAKINETSNILNSVSNNTIK